MRYRTIVADPPWDYAERNASWVKRDDGRLLPYSTLTLDEIKALPVPDLVDDKNGDAHLYLWATNRYLADAFGVVQAWGFDPTATLVWCKAARGWAVGGTFASNVEFVVHARRTGSIESIRRVTAYIRTGMIAQGLTIQEVSADFGFSRMAEHWQAQGRQASVPTIDQWTKLKAILQLGDEMDELVAELNSAKGERTPQGSTTRWFQWPRGQHSAKPEAFLDLVEAVSPGPYLEMFARRNRLGWDTWGNESLNHVEIA